MLVFHRWLLPALALILLFLYCCEATKGEEKFDENEKDAYYKWFEMTRTSFDKDQLASRYRKLARQYHPDKNKEPGVEKIFYKISKAFDVLNDDGKRKRYDIGGVKAVDDSRGGAGGGDAQFAHDIFKKMFEGFFEMDDIFGGGREGGGRRRQRGPSSQTELEVTLEDLYKGKTIELSYTRTKICSHCHGNGADDPTKVQQCGKCRGTGIHIAIKQLGMGFIQHYQVKCDKCEGRGNIFTKKCHVCAGNGLVRGQEKLEVVILPGMRDREILRFEGLADEHPDLDSGDMNVILMTKEHSKYQRDGPHLYINLHLTLREALLGFNKEILQLDGKPFELIRKEVTQNDFVEQIMGRGMPRRDYPERRGDLFVRYHVVLPNMLSKEQFNMLDKILPRNTAKRTYNDEL